MGNRYKNNCALKKLLWCPNSVYKWDKIWKNTERYGKENIAVIIRNS